MYPGIYMRALATVTNMSRANYFYITAYPTYSGFRVEHDPTLTLYLDTSTSQSTTGAGIPFLGLLLGGVAVAVVVVLAVLVGRIRKKP
jgi:hypothetical protein